MVNRNRADLSPIENRGSSPHFIAGIHTPVSHTPGSAEDVTITPEFYRRPIRVQNPVVELDAINHMARFLTAEPAIILQQLALVVVRACGAGSAGVMLEERRANSDELQWVSAAGQLAQKRRHHVPRLSPFGAVVDRQQIELFRRPELFYPDLLHEELAYEELLVVPWQLFSGRRGVIWAALHKSDRHFDPEDHRLIRALGNFSKRALQRNETQENQRSGEALKSATRLANELAHEINNPLQALMNTLHLVSPAVHDEHLTEACDQARRIAYIVQSLLAIKRIDKPLQPRLLQLANSLKPHWIGSFVSNMSHTTKPSVSGAPRMQIASISLGPSVASNRIIVPGKMGDLVRNYPWDTTSLGPMGGWSEALAISINSMLSCQFPSVILCGEEMVQIYNDAYLPLMAEKHPFALGQGAQECWSEAWHIIGPQFEMAFHSGIPTYKQNVLVPVIRDGKLQDVYWTYSYSPLHDLSGIVVGVLIVCHDVHAQLDALRNLHANEILVSVASRESEAKLKLATTAAELGIWVWYMNEDRGTWENDRMYAIFGSTREDGPLNHAQFIAHAFHPEEGSFYLQKIETAIQTGEPFVFEGRFHPQGRPPGWVEFQGQVEYGTDGNPWRILGTARDVTSRKQADIALRASEERLRLAQTAGKLATWEWDLETNEFLWSGDVKKVYGLPAEELTALDRITSYLHPDDREKAMEAVYGAARRGVEFKHEFRVIRPDGVVRWVAGRGTRVDLSDGRAARVVGINWDITEEKLAEDALVAERKRMQELFVQAPALIAVFRGPQHTFEMVNLRYYQLVGNRDLIGKPAREALPEIDDQGLLTALTNVYQSGQPHVEQAARISLSRSEGQPPEDRYVDYLYQPLREPDGSISGVICLGVDVTERKQAEQALIQSEKLAAVGRLASSIAHEINNPLESVTNLLYLAAGSGGLSPVAEEYLASAERELRRVSNIANQTLRFHKQATNPTVVNCHDLIGESLSIYQSRILDAQIDVELRKRNSRPVTCFEGEIRQVLNNLLSNAIDAMRPGGGRLICRSRAGTNWKTGKQGLVLTIADTGLGMSPPVVTRIFEPFFSTKGIGGSGLGLWISCEIINRHEGNLRVRSSQREHHSGTVFTVFLPFDAVKRPQF